MTYFRLITGLLVIPKLFLQTHFNELKPCKTIFYVFIWMRFENLIAMTFFCDDVTIFKYKGTNVQRWQLQTAVSCVSKVFTMLRILSLFVCFVRFFVLCLASVLRSVTMTVHQNNPPVTYFGISALSACWRNLFQETWMLRYAVDILVVLYKWKNV